MSKKKKARRWAGSKKGAAPQKPNLTATITFRVSADTFTTLKTRAAELGVGLSDLARAAVEGNLDQLPVAAIVPTANCDAWLELRVLVEDMHTATRTLDMGRSAALDAALNAAASSSGDLVHALRHYRRDLRRKGAAPDNVVVLVSQALTDARAVSSSLHALLAMRIEELDMDRVLAVGSAVDALRQPVLDLSCTLLGGVPSTEVPA